jgi:hypothetical protein
MNRAKYILPILALALLGVGCSSGKTENKTEETAAVPTDVYVPGDGDVVTPPGSGGGSNTAANSVVFTPVSFVEMNNYVATHPLNAPSDIRVTVENRNDGTNRFYGTVKISYMDNGYRYEGVFESGSDVNPYIKYSESNNLKEYAYNIWFNNPTNASQKVFTGFYQDTYGAIVLVVDGTQTINQGDGQGGEQTLTGSIWYKNFPTVTNVQGPLRKCWYITLGPYDCRSNPVIYKNGIYPTDTYRKLGTFTGLSKSKAFLPAQ